MADPVVDKLALEHKFFKAILDTIQDNIVVIDKLGTILYVNRSWCTFGMENGLHSETTWLGQNYLSACDNAAKEGMSLAKKCPKEFGM